MSQDDAILAHIHRHGSITPLEAAGLGCLALHSACARLRKRGFAIVCKMQHRNGKHFGLYSIAEPKQREIALA